jgi:SAM-dependent methyltransferase
MFTTKAQQHRSETLYRTLQPLGQFLEGRDVLDFGGEALSTIPLLDCGAASVVAWQPDEERVAESNRLLKRHGYYRGTVMRGEYAPDLSYFGSERFDTVIANAVLEHIPQPRGAYIAELWRVLKSGGHLIINETPNKYLPFDFHTTKLPLIPWLPSGVAHFAAEKLGRLRHVNDPWPASGWRGLGYFEMVAPIADYTLIPERANGRHRILAMLGIPASILDPYPLWILRKH